MLYLLVVWRFIIGAFTKDLTAVPKARNEHMPQSMQEKKDWSFLTSKNNLNDLFAKENLKTETLSDVGQSCERSPTFVVE